MLTDPDVLLAFEWVRHLEVFVVDTDVVLTDACAMLASGQRSALLRAVDLGTAIGIMSHQTFLELGWMSALAARGNAVDHDELRALIVEEYLPRIPVVNAPIDPTHWMPSAPDVLDIDDVPHAQLARLTSAVAIYSHDKHLRRPRLAPATRADYDRRVANLSALSDRRETEQTASVAIGLVGAGSSATVTWVSSRLGARPAVVWTGLAVLAALTAYRAFRSPAHRQTMATALAPASSRYQMHIDQGSAAQRALWEQRLIEVTSERLETRVASYLVRHPGSTMRYIADALVLPSADRRRLSRLLREHPAFELVSRYGWAVGHTRPRLTTFPSRSWVPRTGELAHRVLEDQKPPPDD